MPLQLCSSRLWSTVALTLVLATASAQASAGSWQLSSVRGLVVYLQDGKWQELDPSQVLGQTTIRTLRSGRVQVEAAPVTVDMGPNSAVKFSPSSDGSSASIDQYEGSVSISTPPGSGSAPLVLRAAKMTLLRITGTVDVSVLDSVVSVVVKSGSVTALSAGAKAVQLVAGNYETDGTGMLLAAVSSSQTGTSTADETAATATTPVGAGKSNAGGVGNGNGPGANNSGGNGNGTAGNSGGGNGNGNGSGGNNGGGNGKGNGNGKKN